MFYSSVMSFSSSRMILRHLQVCSAPERLTGPTCLENVKMEGVMITEDIKTFLIKIKN